MHCAIVCHWDIPNDTRCHWAKVPLKRANGGVPLGVPLGHTKWHPRYLLVRQPRPCIGLPAHPPPLSSPSCPRARVPFGVSRWYLVSPRAVWCVPLAHRSLAHRSPGTPLTPALHRPPAHPPVGTNGTQWHAPAASAVDRRSPAPISVPVPLFRPKLALIGSSVRCVSDFRPSELSSHAVLQRKSSFSLPWGHATQKIGSIHRTEQPISATKRRKSGSEGR